MKLWDNHTPHIHRNTTKRLEHKQQKFKKSQENKIRNELNTTTDTTVFVYVCKVLFYIV